MKVTRWAATLAASAMAIGTLALAGPALADDGPYSFTPTATQGQNSFIDHSQGAQLVIDYAGIIFTIRNGTPASLLSHMKTASAERRNIAGAAQWWSAASGGTVKLHERYNYGQCWAKNGEDLRMNDCTQGADNQKWIFYSQGGGGRYTIVNPATGKSVGVYGTNPDRPVYVQDQHSGFYVGWTAYIFN